MAIQTIPGGVWLPGHPATLVTGISAGLWLTTNGQKVGYIFRAPKSGNIRKIVWATVATQVTTISVTVETVDASAAPARPSGTLWATNTSGSTSLTGADANMLKTTTLTADATVAAGDLLAVVFDNTVNAGVQFQSYNALDNQTFPYTLVYNGSSWNEATNLVPSIALEYSDGSYEPIAGMLQPAAALSTLAFNTSTTPDVAGLRFQLPFPARVSGCWLYLANTSSVAFNIYLVSDAYNQGAATGILASVEVPDGDVRGNSGRHRRFCTFDTAVELAAATNYRLIVEPATTTSISLHYISPNSLAMMDSWQGGRNFHLTTAKDPTGDGSWTNYNSGTFRQPLMGLLLDGFDAGGGGGGTGSVLSTPIVRAA